MLKPGTHTKKADRSRAKFRCPDALQRWLRRINLIDPSATLRPWSEVFARHFDELNRRSSIQASLGNQLEAERSTYKELFGQFPTKALPELVVLPKGLFRGWTRIPVNPAGIAELSEDLGTSELQMAQQIYEEIREAREFIRKVANHCFWLRENKRGRTQGFIGFSDLPDLPRPRLKMIGTKGMVVSHGLAALVDGLDLDRVRCCITCKRYFWAQRHDSETDSPQCLNILRQRQYREENRDAIRERRKKAYQSKKELREGQRRAKRS